MIKKYYSLIIITFLVIHLIYPLISSANEIEETGDYILAGLELEKVLSFVNGVIALTLFALAFISYKRDGRKRLLYVSIAFALFSLKGFLLSSEIFFPDVEWIDPSLIILEFLVLVLFFFGVLRKGG